MKKRPNKIVTLALTLLLTLGFSGARYTNAYFNDTESSSGNVFSASSLDFSLDSPDDFSPEVTPDDDALRSAEVLNEGSLGFSYKIAAENFTGDASLCNALNLSSSLDGGAPSTEPLATFEVGPFDFGAPEDWDFTAELTDSDESLQEKTCNFDLVFSGWQTELGEGNGFTDEEILSSTVISGAWVVDSCVTEPDDIISTVITGSSFGTNGHNLIVALGGELKSPASGGSNGIIVVSTDCDVTVQSGGKITATKGDGTGGTMTISVRDFTIDVGGIVSASSTTSGKGGGTTTVTTVGDFTVNGTLSADGHDDGGTVIVDSGKNISISGSSLTAISINKDGGNIILSADEEITVSGLVSASAKDQGGTIVILAGGDLSVSAGGSLSVESTNKKGGRIEGVVDGGADISGTLSVDGEDGEGLIVITIQGNMVVSGTGLISANSTGESKDGGTIGIKVGGDATYTGTVRANATDDGKIIALWSEGGTTVSGTVSATGNADGGVIDITTRATLSGAGTLDASGAVNGLIIERTVTNSFAGTATPAATTQSITLSDIVLNEIIPSPTGSDIGSSALPLDGEWVELYNKGIADIDVSGWILKDADGNTLTITSAKGDNDNDLSDAGETIVPTGGTLTVYRNGAGGLTLNDDGDTVQLLTDISVLVDSFTYVLDVGSGNSIARMPDGTGAWVDPEPTPSALNGGINIEKLRLEFLEKLSAAGVVEKEEAEISEEPGGNIPASNPEVALVEELKEVIAELLPDYPAEETPIVAESESSTPVEEIEIVAPEPEVTISTEPVPEETEETPVVEELVVPEVVTEILEAVETFVVPESVEVIEPITEPMVEPIPVPEATQPSQDATVGDATP